MVVLHVHSHHGGNGSAAAQYTDLSGMSACLEKELQAAPLHRIASIGMTINVPLGVRLAAEDRSRLENAAHVAPSSKACIRRSTSAWNSSIRRAVYCLARTSK